MQISKLPWLLPRVNSIITTYLSWDISWVRVCTLPKGEGVGEVNLAAMYSSSPSSTMLFCVHMLHSSSWVSCPAHHPCSSLHLWAVGPLALELALSLLLAVAASLQSKGSSLISCTVILCRFIAVWRWWTGKVLSLYHSINFTRLQNVLVCGPSSAVIQNW